MKFEYKVWKIVDIIVDIEQMNVLGYNGWELVSVVGGIAFFKRELEA